MDIVAVEISVRSQRGSGASLAFRAMSDIDEISIGRDHNANLSALAACCFFHDAYPEGSESIIALFAGRNDLHLQENFRLDQLSNDLEHERRSNIA
jgi:hypothetical protein